MTVKGRRSLGDGKFMHLEKVFAVPKDTKVNKIKGKFDGACLSLFMPKSEETNQKEKKSQEAGPPQEPKSEETNQKEKFQGAVPSKEPKSEEISQKEKSGDKKEEAPSQKDQLKNSARKEEEPIQKEKAKEEEETKAAAPVHEEKPLMDEKKEEHLIQDEPVQKEKPLTDEKKEEHLIQDESARKKQPMSCTVGDDRFEKYKMKGVAWKGRIEEEVEWWLDYGLIDGLLETISKNKKVIAVAVAAFSAGFYVSQKLRSSGR